MGSQGQREVRFGGRQQQVVMVIHQDIGVQNEMVAFDDLGENGQKPLAVFVGAEDGLAFVSPSGDVVERPRILQSRRPSHRFFYCQIYRPDPILFADGSPEEGRPIRVSFSSPAS